MSTYPMIPSTCMIGSTAKARLIKHISYGIAAQDWREGHLPIRQNICTLIGRSARRAFPTTQTVTLPDSRGNGSSNRSVQFAGISSFRFLVRLTLCSASLAFLANFRRHQQRLQGAGVSGFDQVVIESTLALGGDLPLAPIRSTRSVSRPGILDVAGSSVPLRGRPCSACRCPEAPQPADTL